MADITVIHSPFYYFKRRLSTIGVPAERLCECVTRLENAGLRYSWELPADAQDPKEELARMRQLDIIPAHAVQNAERELAQYHRAIDVAPEGPMVIHRSPPYDLTTAVESELFAHATKTHDRLLFFPKFSARIVSDFYGIQGDESTYRADHRDLGNFLHGASDARMHFFCKSIKDIAYSACHDYGEFFSKGKAIIHTVQSRATPETAKKIFATIINSEYIRTTSSITMDHFEFA